MRAAAGTKSKGRDAMRTALIGLALVMLGVVLGWSGEGARPLEAQTPGASRQGSHHPAAQWGHQGGDLIALSHRLENGDLQVVLVDGQTRVMSVYHVTAADGAITLKSVRNVRWDLLMEEYNGAKPYPREIRALLERR